MKVAALIPCRTGSKGIPNKNFKEISNRKLYIWTLAEATKCAFFDKIILSSDGGIVESFNGKVIVDNDRPSKYATDNADLDSLLVYYMNEYPEIELWCLLQPTSPLRKASDIKKAYKMALRDKYGSVVSVTSDPMMYWVKNATNMGHVATYHPHKRPNRQDRQDFYKENGAIYFVKKYALETVRHRCGGNVGLYVMPKKRSIEIDDETDWKVVEYLMERRT